MNEIALSLLAPTQPLDADQGVMSPMASSDQAISIGDFRFLRTHHDKEERGLLVTSLTKGFAETSFPYRYTSMCTTICSITHSRADAAAAKQA
ncbi:hypothetical protein PHYSODRAFT_287328, partial [Phytophthora sojae]